jgi:hypothetical protein
VLLSNFRNKFISIQLRSGKVLICIVLTIILLPDPGRAYSQNMEYGLFGGIAYYLGDLNPGVHFKNVQPAYGIFGRYNIDPRWAVKLSATRGKVKSYSGTSSFLPDRQLGFESPVTDISAVAEFNFFPYITGSQRNYFTPYIYAGVGVFWFNPSYNGHLLRPLGTEGQNVGFAGRKPYSTFSFDIPFGLGVKYSLTSKIGLTLFWEMHKTFTDYLDDVSKTYYLNGYAIDPNNQAQILSDPTMNHQPGMQRGNSNTNDWYSFTGITIAYKFNLPGSKKCKDIHSKQ